MANINSSTDLLSVPTPMGRSGKASEDVQTIYPQDSPAPLRQEQLKQKRARDTEQDGDTPNTISKSAKQMTPPCSPQSLPTNASPMSFQSVIYEPGSEPSMTYSIYSRSSSASQRSSNSHNTLSISYSPTRDTPISTPLGSVVSTTNPQPNTTGPDGFPLDSYV
eukprot:GEMP01025623.1.p1 GENE.GEMP01025623.1~~GEMP01025623.1.p1  ORF type:complete len:164 (+),score=29.70 GEMP01025623.1:57-548(+)